MPNPLLQKQLARFDDLEVSYKIPIGKCIIEPLLLNTEQEEVLKSFLSDCHKETIESIIEMAEGEVDKAEKMEEGYKDVELAIGAVKALSDFISKLKELIK